MATKLNRLVALQNKLERRLVSLARKEGLGSINQENENIQKQPDKIVL